MNKRIDIIPIEFSAPIESQIDSVFVDPALLQQSKYSILLPGTIQGSV